MRAEEERLRLEEERRLEEEGGIFQVISKSLQCLRPNPEPEEPDDFE